MGRKILLVDDEEDVHGIVDLMLSKEGFEITSAMNAAEALGMVHEEHFDAILLDLMMPGMSGKDFLRIIKKGRDTSSIPVIVFTAIKPEDAMEECKKIGADGYVHKPFAKKILVRELCRALAGTGGESSSTLPKEETA